MARLRRAISSHGFSNGCSFVSSRSKNGGMSPTRRRISRSPLITSRYCSRRDLRLHNGPSSSNSRGTNVATRSVSAQFFFWRILDYLLCASVRMYEVMVGALLWRSSRSWSSQFLGISVEQCLGLISRFPVIVRASGTIAWTYCRNLWNTTRNGPVWQSGTTLACQVLFQLSHAIDPVVRSPMVKGQLSYVAPCIGRFE